MNKVRSVTSRGVPTAAVAELLEQVRHGGRLVFFTGAGISASAGVPLGDELAEAIRFMIFLERVQDKRIEDLATRFSANPHVRRRVGQLFARFGDDVSAAARDWMPRKVEDPEVLVAFDRFCQTTSVTLSRARSSTLSKTLCEFGYAELFDWHFRNDPQGRNAFIRDVVAPYSNPSVEHLLLADLAHTRWQQPKFKYPNLPRADSVHPVLFTFNFDHLIEHALSLIGAGVYSGEPPGGSSNEQAIPDPDELLAPAVIHLHGHAGSGTRNTDPEMLEQSKRICKALQDHLTKLSLEYGDHMCLVVLGYGGHSSDALFEYLGKIKDDPIRPHVYWGSRHAKLPKNVERLLKAYGNRAHVLEPTLYAADVLERTWEGLRDWPITSLYRRERRWLAANYANPRWGGPPPAPSITLSVGAAFNQGAVPWYALSPLCRAEVRLQRLKEDYGEIRELPASDRSRIAAWQTDAEAEFQVLEEELSKALAGPCRFLHHLASVRHFMNWQLHPGAEATALKQALAEGWQASDHQAFLNLVSEAQRVLGRLPLRHPRYTEAAHASAELERELQRKGGAASGGQFRGPALRAMIGLT